MSASARGAAPAVSHVLERLFARNFRCYRAFDVEFHPRLNVLVGPNGAGKTNLLEAIHYLGLGVSFRATRDAEAVRWGQAGFFIKGRRRDRLGPVSLEVAYQPGRGKSVRVSGQPLSSLSDLYGTLPCVTFTPDELEWAKGPPGARRRWLDRLLCQTSRAYVEALSAYRIALAQRNTLLQDLGGRGSARELLTAWTEEYLERAVPVAFMRARALAVISGLVREEMAELSPGEPVELGLGLRIAADPDLGAASISTPQAGLSEVPADEGGWRDRYRRQLESVGRAEAVRGYTLVGPHRDDVVALLAGRDARRFASQGQQRSLVVALKLAEVRYIAASLDRPPILLLDDVFSELDPDRRARLTHVVAKRAQTFLTTTEIGLVPAREDVKIFHVIDAEVSSS